MTFNRQWVLLGIGGVLLIGIVALAVIPTPADQQIISSGQEGSTTTGSTTEQSESSATGTKLGTLSSNPPPAFTVNPTEKTGVIEGTFSYLQRVAPKPGSQVCAVNQESFLEVCTSDLIENDYFLYGVGYRLEVPPGTYTVYAQAPGEEYRAYYTPYVSCGHLEGCDDHNPVPVVVSAGKVTKDIQPDDWTQSPDF